MSELVCTIVCEITSHRIHFRKGHRTINIKCNFMLEDVGDRYLNQPQAIFTFYFYICRNVLSVSALLSRYTLPIVVLEAS
jgi:hypothetical protein